MIQVTHSLNSIFLEFKLHLYRSFCSDHLSSFLFLGENKWKAVGPWLGFLATHTKTNMRQWKNNNLKIRCISYYYGDFPLSCQFSGVSSFCLGYFLCGGRSFFFYVSPLLLSDETSPICSVRKEFRWVSFCESILCTVHPRKLNTSPLASKNGWRCGYVKLRDGRNSTGGTPWFRLQVVARTDWKTGFFSPFLMVQGDKSLDKPKNAAWN